jgi:hypothetical protein
MRRGEIVEVDWQYSDLTGSKRRPTSLYKLIFLTALSTIPSSCRSTALVKECLVLKFYSTP